MSPSTPCTRKNFLFLGSETSGARAAILYTMLETAKLSGIDPEAYLLCTVRLRGLG